MNTLNFNKDELRQLRKDFRMMDKDNSGKLSFEEVKKILGENLSSVEV